MNYDVRPILDSYLQRDERDSHKLWHENLASSRDIAPANKGILAILEAADNPVQLKKELAGIIDHTLLKPEATKEHIRILCQEAREYKFASVCVNSCYVETCKNHIGDADILIATVVGFPLGTNATKVKAYEAEHAVKAGADELDMVQNIGLLKDSKYDAVLKDIESVVQAAGGKTVKVILETCLLSRSEIATSCLICRDAGAHFVKTSTGFNSGGATREAVELMRHTVGMDLGVKAAGGIGALDDALKMIRAGASRIGASRGVEIVS